MATIKTSFVRELLRKLDNEEISISRMAEMLNEKAAKAAAEKAYREHIKQKA